MTRTLAVSLAWGADGAAHLRGLMSRLGDEAFAAPSALPGWTRGHLLTHVARNAEAMINLLTWARTGVETPAYASREQRDADIQAGARRPPEVIRSDVVTTSDRLAQVVKAMPEQAWSRRIRDAQGRAVPATDIAWLRAREMWIHSVDLDVGATFEDFPAPMLDELVSDVVASMAERQGVPRVRMIATDRQRTWSTDRQDPEGRAAAEDDADRIDVRATVADLAMWVAGRGATRRLTVVGGGRLPDLPAWL